MEEKSKIKQEDIILASGYYNDKFTNTDNITNLVGTGDSVVDSLRDHIIELILYYENKLRDCNG